MLALAPEEYEPHQSPPPGTNVITVQLLTSRVIRDITGMRSLAYIRGLLVAVLTASLLSDVFLMLLWGTLAIIEPQQPLEKKPKKTPQ